jgi:hypothetical protein
MKARNWNPDDGDALQGDVILFRVPGDVKLDRTDEISPRGNRLILAEGEVTGHHHAIWQRNPPTMLREDGAGSGASLEDTKAMVASAAKPRTGTAKLYRDTAAVAALVSRGLLQHDRCAIGFLVVDGGPVTLKHDEHNAIRIPQGRYYVGGQQEWDAAEARRVQD